MDEAQVLTDQVEKMQQDLQHLKQVRRYDFIFIPQTMSCVFKDKSKVFTL